MPARAKGRTAGETGRQLRRYLVIGTTSVLVDYVTYLLLTRAGLGTHTAKGLSYVAGMSVGFLGNKFWTFESARRSAAEPVTYALLYAATLALNLLTNAGTLAVLSPFGPVEAARGLAFLSATGLSTVLNFLGMRFVTFRHGIRERQARAVIPPPAVWAERSVHEIHCPQG